MPNKTSAKQENGSHTKLEAIKNVKIGQHVRVFENSVQKSEGWIKEMQSELDWVSADSAYHLLRSVLHVLRDNFSIDEAAHFSAQLPLVLRGTFYECWNPQKNQVQGLTKEEFLNAVRSNMGPSDRLNYDFEKGVVVAVGVIMNHISQGEMDDIIQSQKHSLKNFFETIENFNLGVKFQ